MPAKTAHATRPMLYGPDGNPLKKALGSGDSRLLRKLGVDEDAYMYAGFSWLPNEDDLVERKGFDIWDTMMNEVEIQNGVDTVRRAVIASNWEISPASSNIADVQRAEFVKWNFDQMDGSVLDFLFNVLSAIYRGYSVTEKCFRVCDYGEYSGAWVHESMDAKYAGDYEIQTDQYLRVTNLLLMVGPEYQKPVGLDKFILFAHYPKDGIPHGRSVLRPAYKHYWMKDFLLKWWAVYCETFGMPTRVASYPAQGGYMQTGSGDNASQTRLQAVLKDIMNNTAITVPDDIKVEFMEISGGGALAFKQAIDYQDRMMKTAILGQTLTSGTDGGKGSYALADIHADTKIDYITQTRKGLEECINEQVIKQLIYLNFGRTERFPKFSLSPRMSGIETMTADDITKYKSAGIIVDADIDAIRARKLGLPPREIADTQTGGNAGGNAGDDEPGAEDTPDAGNADGFMSDVGDDPRDNDEPAKKFARRAPNKYEGRVDFAKMDKDMTAAGDALIEPISKIIEDMKLKTVSRVANVILAGGTLNMNELSALKLIGIGNISKAYRETMTDVIQDQLATAYKEIDDGAMSENTLTEAANVEKFVTVGLESQRVPEVEIAKIRKWVESGDWAALRAWRKRKALELAGVADAQAFWITDVIKTDILKGVKDAIIQGVTYGKDVRRIASDVGKVFESYIARGEQVNESLMNAPRLEKIVRTNVTRTFNVARKQAFTEGAATGNFPALEYSAILDDRVSDICESLDGKVYAADDPIWSTITPPNHYNCRSTLVPVYKDDVPEKYSPQPNLKEIPSEFGGLKE